MVGKYAFEFGGSSVNLPAHGSNNDNLKCTTAVNGLASVEDASCVRESMNDLTGAASYLITLNRYPTQVGVICHCHRMT
jgi:hypothetical protein